MYVCMYVIAKESKLLIPHRVIMTEKPSSHVLVLPETPQIV
jgi:hypothetical protein